MKNTIYNLRHYWLCYREHFIIFVSLFFFIFAFIFLLGGIETVVDEYPYYCLAAILIGITFFLAANKLTKKY